MQNLGMEDEKKMLHKTLKIIREKEAVIDGKQKTLAKLRAEIPEKCANVLKEEKLLLLEHYMESQLKPEQSLSVPVDVERLKTEIKNRQFNQKSEIQSTQLLTAQLEQIVEANNKHKDEVLNLADFLLNSMNRL